MGRISPRRIRTFFPDILGMKFKLFFLFTFFISSPSVYSQTSGDSDYFWVSLGKGFFGSKNSPGSILYGSADLSLNRHIESLDGIKHVNNSVKFRFIRYYELVEEAGHNDRLNEFDILYGKTFGNVIQLNVSGGLGILLGYDYVDVSNWPPPVYQNVMYRNLNIPIEIGASIVSRFLGFGVAGYASINFKKPIYGIVGKIELGKIR